METLSHLLTIILHYSLVNPEFHPVLYTLQESLRWFLITGAVFIPLAMMLPADKEQPVFRRDLWSDAAYMFLSPHVYGPLSGMFAGYFISLNIIRHVQHWGMSQLNILVQALLILLTTDVLQYGLHRLFHRETLWKFHAIHHSSVHVDWMSSARFHPVNIILYSTLANALVAVLGWSPDAFGVLFLFNVFYSPLVHANLDWSYGPFKYLLASPVFHRWHHTHPDEGGNKNFAPTFPFLDMAFGTFYMPEGKKPSGFGTPYDVIPSHIAGQLIYPFRSQKPPAANNTPAAASQAPEKNFIPAMLSVPVKETV